MRARDASNRDLDTTAIKIKFSPFTWLNLVCLDAPLVAVSWLWLFARSCGITVAYGGTVALFLTAWLIYLADRLGDSMAAPQRAATSLRQRFCIRHRAAWMVLLGTVALADLLVVFAHLDPRMLWPGAIVGAAAMAYLIVNQLRPSIWRRLPLKEISVGSLFTAGTLLPLAHGLGRAHAPAALLFACLCSMNCITIAVWERWLDVAQERVSVATAIPSIGRWLMAGLLVLSTAGLGLVLFGAAGSPIFLCIAVSAALLAALHRARGGLQPDARTALADIVLLTPIIAAIIWR